MLDFAALHAGETIRFDLPLSDSFIPAERQTVFSVYQDSDYNVRFIVPDRRFGLKIVSTDQPAEMWQDIPIMLNTRREKGHRIFGNVLPLPDGRLFCPVLIQTPARVCLALMVTDEGQQYWTMPIDMGLFLPVSEHWEHLAIIQLAGLVNPIYCLAMGYHNSDRVDFWSLPISASGLPTIVGLSFGQSLLLRADENIVDLNIEQGEDEAGHPTYVIHTLNETPKLIGDVTTYRHSHSYTKTSFFSEFTGVVGPELLYPPMECMRLLSVVDPATSESIDVVFYTTTIDLTSEVVTINCVGRNTLLPQSLVDTDEGGTTVETGDSIKLTKSIGKGSEADKD